MNFSFKTRFIAAAGLAAALANAELTPRETASEARDAWLDEGTTEAPTATSVLVTGFAQVAGNFSEFIDVEVGSGLGGGGLGAVLEVTLESTVEATIELTSEPSTAADLRRRQEAGAQPTVADIKDAVGEDIARALRVKREQVDAVVTPTATALLINYTVMSDPSSSLSVAEQRAQIEKLKGEDGIIPIEFKSLQAVFPAAGNMEVVSSTANVAGASDLAATTASPTRAVGSTDPTSIIVPSVIGGVLVLAGLLGAAVLVAKSRSSEGSGQRSSPTGV